MRVLFARGVTLRMAESGNSKKHPRKATGEGFPQSQQFLLRHIYRAETGRGGATELFHIAEIKTRPYVQLYVTLKRRYYEVLEYSNVSICTLKESGISAP